MVNCGSCGKPIKITRDKHYFDEKTKKRYHLGCIVDICEVCGKPIKKGVDFENEHGAYFHKSCFRRRRNPEIPYEMTFGEPPFDLGILEKLGKTRKNPEVIRGKVIMVGRDKEYAKFGGSGTVLKHYLEVMDEEGHTHKAMVEVIPGRPKPDVGDEVEYTSMREKPDEHGVLWGSVTAKQSIKVTPGAPSSGPGDVVEGEAVMVGRPKPYPDGDKFYIEVKDDAGRTHKAMVDASHKSPWRGDRVRYTTKPEVPDAAGALWGKVSSTHTCEVIDAVGKDKWVAEKHRKEDESRREEEARKAEDLKAKYGEPNDAAQDFMDRYGVSYERLIRLLRDTAWFQGIAEGEGGEKGSDGMPGYPGTGMRRPGGALHGLPGSQRSHILKSALEAGLIETMVRKKDGQTGYNATEAGAMILTACDRYEVYDPVEGEMVISEFRRMYKGYQTSEFGRSYPREEWWWLADEEKAEMSRHYSHFHATKTYRWRYGLGEMEWPKLYTPKEGEARENPVVDCAVCHMPVDTSLDDAYIGDHAVYHRYCFKGTKEGEWYDWGDERENPIPLLVPIVVGGAKMVGRGVKKAAVAGAKYGGKGMVAGGKGMIWSGEKLQEGAEKATKNPVYEVTERGITQKNPGGFQYYGPHRKPSEPNVTEADVDEMERHFKKLYPGVFPEAFWRTEFREVSMEQSYAGVTKLKRWWKKVLEDNYDAFTSGEERKNPLPLIPIAASIAAPIVADEVGKMTKKKKATKNPAKCSKCGKPAVTKAKGAFGALCGDCIRGIGNKVKKDKEQSQSELKSKLGL